MHNQYRVVLDPDEEVQFNGADDLVMVNNHGEKMHTKPWILARNLGWFHQYGFKLSGDGYPRKVISCFVETNETLNIPFKNIPTGMNAKDKLAAQILHQGRMVS